MPNYPIILVPRELQRIQSSQPTLPPEPIIGPPPPKPVEPTPPEPPSLPKRPRERLSGTPWLAGAGFLALAVLAGPLELIAVGGIAAYGIYDATLGYEQRLEEYRKKRQHYETVEMPKWEQAMARWDAEKQRRLSEWERECQRIEADWETKKQHLIEEYTRQCEEILKPENIAQWRSKLIGQVVSADFEESDARQGKRDQLLFQSLKSNFPKLDIRYRQGLPIHASNYLYTPDVIVHDPETSVWIDVEIDEPWFRNDGVRTPIHYEGIDDRRNNFFLDKAWIVIRFSESQVTEYTSSCIKCIAEVLDQFRVQNKLAPNLQHVPALPQVRCWTQDEAVNIERDF